MCVHCWWGLAGCLDGGMAVTRRLRAQVPSVSSTSHHNNVLGTTTRMGELLVGSTPAVVLHSVTSPSNQLPINENVVEILDLGTSYLIITQSGLFHSLATSALPQCPLCAITTHDPLADVHGPASVQRHPRRRRYARALSVDGRCAGWQSGYWSEVGEAGLWNSTTNGSARAPGQPPCGPATSLWAARYALDGLDPKESHLGRGWVFPGHGHETLNQSTLCDDGDYCGSTTRRATTTTTSTAPPLWFRTQFDPPDLWDNVHHPCTRPELAPSLPVSTDNTTHTAFPHNPKEARAMVPQATVRPEVTACIPAATARTLLYCTTSSTAERLVRTLNIETFVFQTVANLTAYFDVLNLILMPDTSTLVLGV